MAVSQVWIFHGGKFNVTPNCITSWQIEHCITVCKDILQSVATVNVAQQCGQSGIPHVNFPQKFPFVGSGSQLNTRFLGNPSQHPKWHLDCFSYFCMSQLCPADATATPSSLASVKSRMVYLSGAGLPRLSWKKGH